LSNDQQETSGPVSEDDRIRAAKIAVDRDYLRLGRELYIAFSTGKYKEEGFSSFDDYAISRGVEAGRANRLRRVFKKFSKDLGIPFVQLLDLGYERVKAIERVIDRGGKAYWLKKAAELSYPDLVRHVKEKAPPHRRRKIIKNAPVQKNVYEPEDAAKLIASIKDDRMKPSADGSGVSGDDVIHVRTLYLIGDQNTVFETAIENMERRTGSQKIGYLLTSALMEFLFHEATRGLKDDKRMSYYMSVLERRYGGKLLWVHDKKVAAKLAAMIEDAEEEVQAEKEAREQEAD
jgi:hypothetical protein